MIFSNLSEKLQSALGKLKSKGKLSAKDVSTVLREVKLALLEADVNFKVVKDFIKTLEEKAVGEAVMKSLTPGQQVIKIVHEELTNLMGQEASQLELTGDFPQIMLVGLQGAGKTTMTVKLGNHILKKGYKPLLVAADVYRPAAIDQLKTLGERVGIPVFSMGTKVDPLDICRAAKKQALKEGCNCLIVDTAGRLHVDEKMMEELERIQKNLQPQEILLVADAMTGQDAVNLAKNFNQALGLTGVILTKMDGDARGGAALSIRSVTGAPIKFVGMGEKIDELEPFHPDRMASRILGMGDVMSLIEKAEAQYDQKMAQDLEKKLRDNSFTLTDYVDQLQQVRNMGPIDQLLGMIPGINKKALKGLEVDEKQFDRIEAIINSMTPKERLNPEIIDGSRRRRIARGSGTQTQEVNRLLKQFKETKKLFRSMQKGKKPFLKGGLPI